jgi:hypothetical protein
MTLIFLFFILMFFIRLIHSSIFYYSSAVIERSYYPLIPAWTRVVQWLNSSIIKPKLYVIHIKKKCINNIMYNVLYKVDAGNRTSTEYDRGLKIMKKTGILFGALGVCVVVALVVGFAGAAAANSHSPGKTARNETAPGQCHADPSKIIDQLEKQGVDVSAVKTAILINDTIALKSWLDAFRTANPRNQTGNENKPDPATIIEKLEKQGVDVSVARTAILNNDTASLKSWLEEFRASHADTIRGNRTGGIPS